MKRIQSCISNIIVNVLPMYYAMQILVDKGLPANKICPGETNSYGEAIGFLGEHAPLVSKHRKVAKLYKSQLLQETDQDDAD